jgi:hypothetical protein
MRDSIPGFDPEVEGAVSRFDLRFVQRIGEDSVLLKALSDLWTIALHTLRKANGLCNAEAVPVLISNDQAVHVLRALCAKDLAMRQAVFQEPFGFARPGAIEREFSRVFGEDMYAQWRDAFEREQFNRCLALMGATDPL